MRRSQGIAIAVMIGGGLIATGAFGGQAQPQSRAGISARALLPETQALLDGYVARKKMPGIVTAIGFGDRPTLFLRAGRIADAPGAPAAGPDSLWRIYSMTKPVTAMAAMILIEEGKIGLDQPIGDFIPAFRSMRVLTSPDTLESRPATRAITIRHLLTHTAGLGYSIVTKGPLLKEYERLGILPAAVNAQIEAQMRVARPNSLTAFANRVATLPLIAEPGTKWSYSIALDVLPRVIEVAGGMPFESFVQRRIFTPLGMNATYWTVPRAQVGRLATNYVFVGGDMVPIDPAATSVYLQRPSFAYGGAGLVSSARDYDRFLHMLQNRGSLGAVRIMKPATAALAMSNLLPPGVSYRARPGDGDQGFGAGGSVYLADVPGGVSKGTYGWGGAAGTVAWVDPVKRVRGTVMVNYFPDDKWPIRREIPAALARDAARFAR